MAKDKKASSGFFDNAPVEKLYEQTTEIDSKTGKSVKKSEDPEILGEISISKSSSSQSSPPPTPNENASSSHGGTVETEVDDALDFAENSSKTSDSRYFNEKNENSLADEPTHILDLEEIQSMPEIKSAKLSVVDGPERGKEFLVSYNEMFGGRSIENDFVISDLAISRRHFRITRRMEDYILTDMQSGNGTYLNGVRTHQQVLTNNDMIVVGKSVIRFTNEPTDQPAEVKKSANEQGFPPPPQTSEATAPPPAPTSPTPPPVANQATEESASGKKTLEMESLDSGEKSQPAEPKKTEQKKTSPDPAKVEAKPEPKKTQEMGSMELEKKDVVPPKTDLPPAPPPMKDEPKKTLDMNRIEDSQPTPDVSNVTPPPSYKKKTKGTKVSEKPKIKRTKTQEEFVRSLEQETLNAVDTAPAEISLKTSVPPQRAEEKKPLPKSSEEPTFVQTRSPRQPVTPGTKPEKEGSGGLIIAVVVALVAVISVGAIVLLNQQKSAPKPAPIAEEAAPKVDPTEAKVKTLMEQARIQLKNDMFDRAIAKCEQALQLSANNTDVLQLKSWIAKEQRFKEIVETAETRLAASDPQDSYEALKEISNESKYHGQAVELIAKFDSLAWQKQVDEADKLMNRRKYNEALEIVNSVLVQKPGHIQAQRIKIICEAKLANKIVVAAPSKHAEPEPAQEPTPPKPASPPPAKTEPASPPPAPKPVASAPPKENRDGMHVTGQSDLRMPIRSFRKQKISDAIDEARAISTGWGHQPTIREASSLLKKLESFKRDWNTGRNAADDSNANKAIPALKSAWATAREISKDSEYEKDIRKMLGNMYYTLGKGFEDQKEWSKAAKSYKRALTANPGHVRASRAMEELEITAKKLYYKGLAAKNSDPDEAKTHWRTVKQLVSKKSKWYRKADEGLKKLE